MLARVLVIAWPLLFACCCGGKQQPSSVLKWTLEGNQSLAYRFNGEVRATTDGEEEETQLVTGFLFVDVDQADQATIHLESSQPVYGSSGFELNIATSNYFFPLPESAIGGEPQRLSFIVKGLGTTSSSSNPDIKISETLTKTRQEKEAVHLSFDRKGKGIGPTPLKLDLQESGNGVFDLKAGRYERLQRTTRMEMSGEMGGESFAISLTVESSLEFDAARSKSRTEQLAKLREPPASEGELSEYSRSNPVASEIEAALRRPDDGRTNVALQFHLTASPVATFRAAMTLSGEMASAFTFAVVIRFSLGMRVPETLVAWFVKELPNHPALAAVVARIVDERLRVQLESIASGQAAPAPDDRQRRIAERARESLALIAAQKVGPSSLLAADEESFMKIAHALQFEGQDHRTLVPVLVQILESIGEFPDMSSGAEPKSFKGPICVQALEGLTGRSFGKDVAAWKRFSEAHKSKSRCQLLVEATEQEVQLLVDNALARLAFCKGESGVVEILARHMHEGEGNARWIAALSLAEHADQRAIPVLIDLLASADMRPRQLALIALANFSKSSMGYDPYGDEASRGMALRRWRAWAQTLAAKPGRAQ